MARSAFIALLLLSYGGIYAQFDFCTGSKGEPIFLEDFGTGTGYGPALPSGLTSYSFASGVPDDGSYTLYDSTHMNANWINLQDHTPNDTDGKALIVNASFSAGEFYRREVTGLCVNTNFEFTAWLINAYDPASQACAGTGIPINVKFQIWDETETTLLTEMNTGDIQGNTNSNWQQFGLTFTTIDQTSVVLKMINNGVGGCGNDLAIDDIMFRSCGDITTIQSTTTTGSEYKVCSANLPVSLDLNVNVTNANPHAFQWQSSSDGVNWTDITGQTSATFTTPNVNASTSFRVKVAQDVANIGNSFCYTLSDLFSITVIPEPLPPTSGGDFHICSNESMPILAAMPGTGESVNWYDAPSGGNLLQAASTTYNPGVAGTYYAEAFVVNGDCSSPTRTPVTLSIDQAPEFSGNPAIVSICEGDSTALDAGVANVSYAWQPGGETTQSITVTQAGTYTVTATNAFLCSASVSFTVIEYFTPEIAAITNDGPTITVTTTQAGDYEYSLDGNSWQASNIFEHLAGGLVTVYVRETHGCGGVSAPYLLVLPPTFFSPNADGANDVFAIPGFYYMPEASVSIFDRYGMLITQLNSANPYWDGTFNGRKLPAEDYWYRIELGNGKEMRGHFALIR